jgi:ferric-dicitrate binding protein FerR (iron transport regulator)
MDELSGRLRELGSAVADLSDRAMDQDGAAAHRVRQAFVAGVAGSGAAPGRAAALRARYRAPAVGALAAAACLLIAAGGARFAASRGAGSGLLMPLTFSVAADVPGAPAAPGVVGDWVAAGTGAPREASFSDGSELELSPGARIRVTTTSPAGADVLIERGAVHVAVAHPVRPAAERPRKWAVRAGPFEVRVTGTTFDAAWDPTAERFELTMIEGRVLVSGPNIPPERAVVGGERLVVSVRDGRMVLSSRVDPPAEPAAAPREPASADPIATPEISATAPAIVPPVGSIAAPAPAAAAPWKDLAAKGRYRDAFAAAEAAGFAQELERAPAGDLLMLADAARFSGSGARAREALLAARRRFHVQGQSAFLLGKIAADQQGSPGDAVGWFEAYLREQPGGPLAEQALGRIVDLSRRGSVDAGRAAAARYLARYPDGSYAALARSLTADPPAPAAPATPPGPPGAAGSPSEL